MVIAMNSRLSGFGLIEILIAIFIVSMGVLAVGNLQTGLILGSSENKARQEAMDLARTRLDEYKNYSSLTVNSSDFPSSTYFNNANTQTIIDGVYADFTLSESYAFSDDKAAVVVKVVWNDRTGESQQVNLSTVMTYTNTMASATGTFELGQTFVDAPTGRAYIGEGEVSSKGLTEDDRYRDEGDDGTSRYDDPNGEDRFLAVDDDVVLTLEDACAISVDSATTADCTDFVEIKGRVLFIDSKITSSRLASDVFVLASDAAYCARYFGSGDTAVQFEAGATPSIASLPSITENGNKYYYFNYTCYIGGGWHGNIGVVGIDDQKDHICVGDPTDEFNYPTETRRRAYRGMAWKYVINSDGSANRDVNGKLDPVKYVSTDQVIADRGLSELVGTTKYYSWGIADATILSSSDNVNHDFLIVESNSGIDCIDYMDTTVFDKNSDDFYCLNEVVSGAEGIAYNKIADEYIVSPTLSSDRTNLDERPLDPDRNGIYFDPDQPDSASNETDDPHYGFYDECPYDPTDPPAYVHQISGQVVVFGDQSGRNADVLASGMKVTTSDGDNCSFISGFKHVPSDSDATSFYMVEYSCDVYDTGVKSGNSLVAAGWSGSVWASDTDSSDEAIVTCEALPVTFINSFGNSSTNFSCSAVITIESLIANDDEYSFFSDSLPGELSLLDNDSWPSSLTTNDFVIEWFGVDTSDADTGTDESGTTKFFNLPDGFTFAFTQRSAQFIYKYRLRSDTYGDNYPPSAKAEVIITVINSNYDDTPYLNGSSKEFRAFENDSINIPVEDLLSAITGGDAPLSVILAYGDGVSFTPGNTFVTFTAGDVNAVVSSVLTYVVSDNDGDTVGVTATIKTLPSFNLAFFKTGPGNLQSLSLTSDDPFSCNGFSCIIYADDEGWTGSATVTSNKEVCGGSAPGTNSSTYTFTVTENTDFEIVTANNCPQ
jgi:Tfp pilus assembly protein PilV